jgi:hypothetical protein
VFVTYPASKSVNEDANNRVLIPYTSGTTNVGSLNVGDATAHTDSGVIAGFTASEPLYLYTSLQNTSASNTSYASYAVNDGGHTAYGELGINNSTYSYSAAGFPNNGFSTPLATFVESYGGPLVLGSWDNQKISMIINGAVSTTDAMTINTNGSVAFNGQVGTAGQLLQSNATSAPTWVTPNAGTVTSVSGTGTVNGISLSGTVTSSGNLTLGGTLDLSSPPTIGNTTPSTGTFTTLIGGGGSANYGQLTGGATTKAVQFQTLGSDSNVSLAIQPKGTGAIDLAAGSSGVNISNGGTVTALTRTAGGAGYTSFPSIAISAPTTAGGVQATATCTVMFNVGATIASGGTGYTVGDTLTMVGGTPTSTGGTFTVTTVSSGVVTGVTANSKAYTVLPSNPVSTTGGTGTGCTLNVTYSVDPGGLTIGTAGSGYVEQPTVTFSGGGGSGATAYATVGSGTTFKSLGTSLSLSTPGGEQVRIVDSAGAVNWLELSGSSGNVVVATNGSGSPAMIFRSKGSGTNAYSFGTANSATNVQMQIASTASAVNYVQVTGAATGGAPAISAQGSDGTIGLQLTPKGGGNITSVGGLAILNSTAIPAGGTLNTGLRFSSTASFGVFFGSGAPTLSAAQGSIYLRSDGSGIANRMYINTNGSTTWTNVVTAA